MHVYKPPLILRRLLISRQAISPPEIIRMRRAGQMAAACRLTDEYDPRADTMVERIEICRDLNGVGLSPAQKHKAQPVTSYKNHKPAVSDFGGGASHFQLTFIANYAIIL